MTLIPQSFFSRTILLVLVPLIMALVIVANVFFGNHWSRVHATMARSLAGEMATITNFIDAGNSDVANSMAHNMGINITTNETLSRPKHNDNASRETGLLARELARKVKRSANIYMDKAARRIEVDIPQKNGTITTFEASLYRVYSTSTEVFIIWLIGTILIVSAFITPFLILHNRSIRRIAHAANRFGRGLDAPGFQPTGSKEIREAATAMITMKERLDRYNRTRTDMLNAVSHDLKSPLARMRLAIETDGADKEALLTDIDRMTSMINGYLAFARGEMPEIEQMTEVPPMLLRIARDAAPDKKILTEFPDTPAQFYARPMALARAFSNIIDNAARYAKSTIKMTEIDTPNDVTVIIED
ncbi:MAG: hypothetical protein J5611_01750, partial [Alphaproteobacteria bacterium]|nr:hypothetical protein [Alphaproteobacteria bacterium]